MKIRCVLLIFLGILALGCGSDEIDPLVVQEEDDVDIRDIRVFAAIDPPLTGYADIKITVVGPYCLKCADLGWGAEYRLEETHLFIRLFVSRSDQTCFCETNTYHGNVSGEVSLRLPLGEYTVFQEYSVFQDSVLQKVTGNPLIVFRVEADKVILSKNQKP